MRPIDWVGLVLVGGVLAGGAFYFVKMRPLETDGYSPTGYPVSVVPQGQNFVVPNGQNQQPAGSSAGQDAVGIIGAVGGLAESLFGKGGVGRLF